jgi:MSHA pilin protein MshA
MKKQQGFTLIELVVVIVILGILAATALPKFVDLSGEAERAATKGVAGAISSAAGMNYGLRKLNSASGVAISDGTDACAGGTNSVYAGRTTLLQDGIVLVTVASANNNEYRIAASGAAACSAGNSVSCSLTSYGGKVAGATVVCTN